jgi:hypothetical protein
MPNLTLRCSALFPGARRDQKAENSARDGAARVVSLAEWVDIVASSLTMAASIWSGLVVLLVVLQ